MLLGGVELRFIAGMQLQSSANGEENVTVLNNPQSVWHYLYYEDFGIWALMLYIKN